MNKSKFLTSYVLGFLSTAFPASAIHAHGYAPWDVEPLPWTSEQITRVIVAMDGDAQVLPFDGHTCLKAPNLAFDVLDAFAFDIDETVWVDVDFYDPPARAPAQLAYDRADSMPGIASASTRRSNSTDHLQRHTFTLEHARFANLGFDGTDFMLYPIVQAGAAQPALTVCGVTIRRSHKTPRATSYGEVSIEIIDENGNPTPARVGIYDRHGRLLLPTKGALTLQSFKRQSRVVQFFLGLQAARPVFYVDGSYHARVPAGGYELRIGKGLEYRMVHRRFNVLANQNNTLKIQVQRWRDMAKDGWISGDDHVHYALESEDDVRAVQVLARAEDVRVTNILHMGNALRTYFPIAEKNWTPIIDPEDSRFILVPGQEDPRTTRRGHTIALNLRAPVRNASSYSLYHEVFEKVRAQGGLVGYAHVIDPHTAFNADRGMAVDVPFGIVDFVEVFSGAFHGEAPWFDFINLGYKLSPTAGSDYPYGSFLGAQRMYVKLDRPLTAKAWFDALKAGRTFVTDGPVLDFSINGKGIGSELSLKPRDSLKIEGRADLNPDFGPLASLDLIEQGMVVKRFAAKAHGAAFTYQMSATKSTWFVVRAKGTKGDVFAISAPIYIVVNGHPFWKRAEVPSIVSRLEGGMARMAEAEVSEDSAEGWESQKPLADSWAANDGLMKARVAAANVRLDEVAKRAAAAEH